jgi:hypothetical protein
MDITSNEITIVTQNSFKLECAFGPIEVNSNIHPEVTNTNDIGSATKLFKDAYVEGSVNTGDVLPNVTDVKNIGSSTLKYNDAHLNGTVNTGDIVPYVTNTKDIGSSTLKYKDSYFEGTSYTGNLEPNDNGQQDLGSSNRNYNELYHYYSALRQTSTNPTNTANFGKLYLDLDTEGLSLQYKNLEYPITGKQQRINFNPIVSHSLFSDAYITLSWDGGNKQPRYQKTATGVNTMGIQIMKYGANTILVNTHGLNSSDEEYFTDNGIYNAAFNITNYQRCDTSICPDSLTYIMPSYNFVWTFGNVGSRAAVMIEKTPIP